MSEELKKRRVDVCCMQEKDGKAKELVLWVLRDEGIHCGVKEMMQDRVGILMKEEITGNVVEIEKKATE